MQVYHDLLGLFEGFVPKHARQYAQLAGTIREAITSYAEDVRAGRFPTDENSFAMDESALAELFTTDDGVSPVPEPHEAPESLVSSNGEGRTAAPPSHLRTSS